MAVKTWSLLIKLVPFLISCIACFTLNLPEPSISATIVKGLPSLSLAFFVAIQPHAAEAWTSYAKAIFQGLLLSAVGDACLVWPQLFFLGLIGANNSMGKELMCLQVTSQFMMTPRMFPSKPSSVLTYFLSFSPAGRAAFAMCHTSYILAFGLIPFRPFIFVMALGFVFVPYAYLVEPCLEGFSRWAETASKVPLSIMTWRALSHPGRRLRTSVGSLLFVASDLFFGIETFCSFLPHSRFLIMSTYYTAQGLFALTVASQRVSKKDS
ncbi:lysoplasmalogenase TMEM86B-like [Anolis carolinensis]|uniref:lysoplasmalogenase TMEM86B-like n=1 Tax=Anolis carolinensis TaxID=28377 RepID=UPI002F2B5F36